MRRFSRYHKYGLGTELRAGAREVPRLVVRAKLHTIGRRAGEAHISRELALNLGLLLPRLQSSPWRPRSA